MLPLGADLVMAAAMVGKFGIAASFAIVFVYAAELLPTPLRSAGMGLCSLSARIGGVVAPMVVLLPGSLPMMIFGTAALMAGLLILILPETLGKPLPGKVDDCYDNANVEMSELVNAFSGNDDGTPKSVQAH